MNLVSGSAVFLELLLVLVVVWIVLYQWRNSARGHQWLIYSVILAIPATVIGLFWLPTTGLASVLPSVGIWYWFELVSVVSFIWAVIGFGSRLAWEKHFTQPVKVLWSRYVLSLVGLLGIGILGSWLPWSIQWTFIVALLIVNGVLLGFDFSRSRLLTSLISAISTKIMLILIGFLLTLIDRQLPIGIVIGSIHLGFDWSNLALCVVVGWTIPSLTGWWLNQR